MRRKRILSQKRPAAGGEARERASFLKIVCCHDFSCQNFFVVFQVAQKELRCIQSVGTFGSTFAAVETFLDFHHLCLTLRRQVRG